MSDEHLSKTELLELITNHYLQSENTSGLEIYNIPSFSFDDLISLIQDDKIRVLTSYDDMNIHINRLDLFSSKEKQIEYITAKTPFTAYPTQKHLSEVSIVEELPFKKMLKSGLPHLHILYFSPEVLELYFNDPKYVIGDGGYRGWISIRNEYYDDNDRIHSECIQDFGIAYSTDKDIDDRAIGVFLTDMAELNLEAQYKWRGFLLEDQGAFRVNKNFVRNLIFCEWTEDYWIFDALLDEVSTINSLCENISLPPFFNNTYSRNSQELVGYRLLLIPSKKNFYDFVSALEKIIVGNINYNFFQKRTTYTIPIERRKLDGSLKGSIEMLSEWLETNYAKNEKAREALSKVIIKPFRNLRKIRQAPAHEMYSNDYDKKFYGQQNELIKSIYLAIYNIRKILAEHPNNANFKLPSSLEDMSKIVIY